MKRILCSSLFALGMLAFAMPAHAGDTGATDKPADSGATKKTKKTKKKKDAEGDKAAGDAAKK